MKLRPVIERLRQRCPSLKGRVGGVAQYVMLESTTKLTMPYAFVVPLGETAEYFSMASAQSYRQTVEAQFGVLLFLSLKGDSRGYDAFEFSQDIRAEVFKALLGACLPETDEITFDQEVIFDANNARLVIQWEFNVPYDIVDEETAHGEVLEQLPELEGIDSQIDPAPADWVDGVPVSFHFNNSKGS